MFIDLEIFITRNIVQDQNNTYNINMSNEQIT